MVVGFVWAFGVMWLVIMAARRFMSIRVSEQAELVGLDEPEFGSVCYPDFVLATSSTGALADAAPSSKEPAPSRDVSVTS